MNSLAPHLKAKALKSNSRRPAKELCSECGLCDTYYIHYVKEACAFLNQQIADLEAASHGKSRDLNQENDLYFGVHQEMMAAKKKQAIPGAQWTGIVSTIACEMLDRGLVEGVVCVQNTAEDRFQPQPILARTTEEILAAKVNKPTLSPNLSVLEEIEKSGMKRLLVIGVGCQIQALRAVEKKLGLEKLYVLGTPCVDNVTRSGLQKFLETTSRSPETVVHYEFMQDFRVHFKHEDGSMEMVPFFGLKTNKLKDVFAPSCMTCFDYVNSLADLVVGYMGAPFGWQWIMVRNDTGKEMLELVKDQLDTQDVMSSGDRKQAVQNSIPAYDKGVTLPMWAAKMMGVVIEKIGPKGLEYARFSIDSHFTRNYLYVKRNYPEKLAAHVPEYAKKIVEQYKLPD
ncbi:MAG: Coenzyme F420 hydrogenase/dehydrogenase, beta subunit C-terminal domain [Microcystis sp.]|jgi:coenzyme F420-reducing hydrogenase beta subunit|uniref:Coenzyme F420 hydrogenase/dehydrogenase, beta subunit C-terminal domain n=1 Tax=unclassified Microcystis TaxID=2643300 RepID=UPI0022C1E922|nr:MULTISPECIES: Coenzyme F420 hydrogenase/dehydrogenase, beta subunit C-terminal domain [unclassified Microcystis]MCE2670497.1 Coenzyme F420 hydrogenase/dehydrogenase, beta subunit C-terminal domain [Microcystis sp. 49638_E5]MCZ8053861.1 Coenzyme F420 hydrogenase/dehydrogenase, beta subunit C-terminal domain [Microcystis sp. LE19-12.2C]MDJ0551911.1 Coenzyme F420 hydrogenase/dehydrogenase, beta subunit C-terminal domain [Microcystis sp. M49637_WE12]MDJ0586501.1 Coenzyme F420 hydrogenase/dehydro